MIGHRLQGKEHRVQVPPYNQQVILYDGVCGLCHRFVRFILRRDKRRRFFFMPLQSAQAEAVLLRHQHEPSEIDTVVLVTGFETGGERLFIRSSAALRVCTQLGLLWPVMGTFFLVPKFFRDAVYDWIGQRRYRWFGQYERCELPSPEQRDRFFGDT